MTTGSLHIFRRHVANGGDVYQVNYSITGSTFAKVFGSQHELRDFLLAEVGLGPSEMDSIWERITHQGNASLDDVEITPQQASALGMTHSDIDF